MQEMIAESSEKTVRRCSDVLFDRLARSLLLTKLRSNPEHGKADRRTDRHCDQPEPEIQLIKNNQRQKSHRADLQKNTNMVQHCQNFREKIVNARQCRS